MRRDSRVAGAVLAGLMLLLFWVRLRNRAMVFRPDGVHFLGNDPLYHMRRVFLALDNGLRIPSFDSFLNYPEGLHPNWPPLYDQFMAAIALVLGRGTPGHGLVEAVGALVPPVLGVLTVPVIYRLARRLMTRTGALCAAAIGGALPYAVQVSMLGRPDHHVAAVLCTSLFCLAAIRSLEAQTIRKACVAGLISGVLLSASLGVWMGSVLFVVIAAVATSVSLIFVRRDPARRECLAAAGICTYLVAAALFLPTAASSYFAGMGVLRWDAPSHFHTFLLLGAACMLLLIRSLLAGLSVPSGKGSETRTRNLVCSVAAAGCVGVCAVGMQLHTLLAGGAEWMLKRDPLMMRLVESTPLTWRSACENFTVLILLVPLVMIWIALEQARRKRTATATFVLCWTAAVGAVTLKQERFADMFSVPVALALGKAVELMVRGVRAVWAGRAGGVRSKWAATMAVCLACVFGAALCCGALPSVRWYRNFWHSAPRLSRHGVYDLCRWLREETPEVPGYDGHGSPEYSVLAGWQLGHAITYIGRRPNVANPFVGWPENRDANLAPYRFFLCNDPTEARELIERYGVRYVIVSEFLRSGRLADMIQALGLAHGDFFTAEGDPADPTFVPTPRAWQSMGLRLFVSDAGQTGDYRLVYRSPECMQVADRLLPVTKVYEFTPALPGQSAPEQVSGN